MGRIYGKAERERKRRWHKEHNQKHQYATKETKGKKYTWMEMYLIWNKRLTRGRILTDV